MRALCMRGAGVGVMALVLTSCGASTVGGVRMQGPWDPALAAFFDDAADFIEDPENLAGDWGASYATEIRGRVDQADLICRVHITTINEDIDVDGRRRKHLLARVTSVLHGRAPDDERLTLSVEEHAPGFDTVDRNERLLFNRRFVAFVRWYQNEGGEVRPHWHLSPESRPVLELLRRNMAERQEGVVPAR